MTYSVRASEAQKLQKLHLMTQTSKNFQNSTASFQCYHRGPSHHHLPLRWLSWSSRGDTLSLQSILQRAARSVTLKLHTLLLQSYSGFSFPSELQSTFGQMASKALLYLNTVSLLPLSPYLSHLTSLLLSSPHNIFLPQGVCTDCSLC